MNQGIYLNRAILVSLGFAAVGPQDSEPPSPLDHSSILCGVGRTTNKGAQQGCPSLAQCRTWNAWPLFLKKSFRTDSETQGYNLKAFGECLELLLKWNPEKQATLTFCQVYTKSLTTCILVFLVYVYIHMLCVYMP